MEEHPLQTAWSIWEHNRGAVDNYGTNMKKVGDFNTVEGFWRFFNHMLPPSQVFATEDGSKRAPVDIEGISLFRKGIRPEWEDIKNMNGGEIFIRKSLTAQALDQWWEGLVLGAIGETLDPTDVLCGVRIVDRSAKGRVMYRAELWFSCSEKSDPGLVEKIRENANTALMAQLKFEYKDHTSTINQGFTPAPHGGGGRR